MKILTDVSKMFEGLNTYEVDKDSDLAKMTNSLIILEDSNKKTKLRGKIVRLLDMHGYIVIKVPDGFPDIGGINPDSGKILWINVKNEHEELSRSQIYRQDMLKLYHQSVFVVSSYGEAMDIILDTNRKAKK